VYPPPSAPSRKLLAASNYSERMGGAGHLSSEAQSESGDIETPMMNGEHFIDTKVLSPAKSAKQLLMHTHTHTHTHTQGCQNNRQNDRIYNINIENNITITFLFISRVEPI